MALVEFARSGRTLLERLTDASAIAVVPVGATEQHGPHLPPSVDTLIAEAVVRAAAKRCSATVFVTPPIAFGVSAHHLGLPGTLSLGSDTFRAVVGDVAGSLVHAGARTVLFVNGHGGNRSVLADAVQRAGRRTTRDRASVLAAPRILATTYWELVSDGRATLRDGPAGTTGHAGAFETSIMLHLAPETVAMELAVDAVPKAPFPGFSSDLFESPTVHGWVDFRDASPSGVFGAPSRATREKGKAAVDAVATALAALFDRLIPKHG